MRKARRASVFGALALAVLIAAACTAPSGGNAPAGEAFYVPPSPLPSGRPGDVIWWRNSAYAGVANVKAFQVLYRSDNATGNPTGVSSTLLVPNAAWTGAGPRPIIGYGAFTLGLGDQCAASRAYNNGNDPGINALLQRGWAVAISDYEGLGTPGVHTYMVGQSQGRAVLDSVRAATRLPATGLDAAAPIGLAGYSQGGASAGWAGELAPTYAPELSIKGIVAGGTPADLIRVSQNLEGGFWYGLAAMAAPGFDAAYPELDLENYLNAAGRNQLLTSTTKCVAGILTVGAYKRTTDFTTTDPLGTPAWQARMAENKLGSRKPPAPALLFHSSDDEVIPVDQAQALKTNWCARGATVGFQTGTGGHVGGVTAVVAPTANYLADRFANRPAPSAC